MGCQAHTDYQKLEQSTPLYWCPLNIWRLSTRGRILWNFFCVFISETFSLLLLKFCSDRGVTSLRESQSHPCCENIQRNDEIPFIPSHWAWNHQHTIFKHFSQLFLEKIWSNLRRQMIRWSIKSALPKYWLGHKEGSKVGFCLQQFLYIRHLFKLCLKYFFMRYHLIPPFLCKQKRVTFYPKKILKIFGRRWLGPKY